MQLVSVDHKKWALLNVPLSVIIHQLESLREGTGQKAVCHWGRQCLLKLVSMETPVYTFLNSYLLGLPLTWPSSPIRSGGYFVTIYHQEP
jgi:hypothetical protein